MRAVWVIALAVVVLLVRPAAADFFSSSPGQLSQSHAALDNANQCNDCHVNGTKDLHDRKCLDCHDHNDLKARIASGKGYHASSAVKGKPCKSCHLEHKGRGYDIMGWKSVQGGQKQFNHDLTGWPLNGKHSQTDCEECHKIKNQQGLKTYMGTDKLCGSSGCHNNDQPHKFVRKDMLACERCHKDNRPLAGSGNLCINCHRQDDVHNNSLSPKCGECHTQWSFTPARFDHARVGCNLTGLHRTFACADCHRAGNFVGLSAQCVSCHRDDAARKDALHKAYTTCANCHNPNFWAPQQTTGVFGRESVCR